MLNKIDKELAFVQSALNLRARRQEILAANLANADTPNYKAQDIDFASALKRAMGPRSSQEGGMVLARTHGGHIEGGSRSGSMGGALLYRSTVQPSLDGNTVDLDIERGHFTENALHYQFLADRAASTFSTLKLAVGSER